MFKGFSWHLLITGVKVCNRLGAIVTGCTSYVLHTSFWLKCQKLRYDVITSLFCLDRLVSKTDNVIYFLCLVKQVSVDMTNLFVMALKSPDATCRIYQPLWWCHSLGQSDRRAELSLMVEQPNGKVAWEQNCLRQSCSWGSPHLGLSSGSWVHPNWMPCNKLYQLCFGPQFLAHMNLRCHDFSVLAD